jgi:hypothetical protein
MTRCRHISTCFWLVAASLVQLANMPRAADAETTAAEEPPLAYRRIFVPADKPDAWPRDGEKFLPIEARDFEAWIAAANRNTSEGNSPATIAAAEYWATLEEDGRLRGRGRWTISLRDERPAFRPLEPMALVLGDPRWQNAESKSVRLGAWGMADQEANRFGLQVPRAGTLEFDWTIPSGDGVEPIEIPWRVPPAVSQRLTLDLPDGMQPTMSGAAVLESTSMPSARRRWLLATNSTPSSVLRIATVTREHGQQPVRSADQITLHEATTYRIEQRGVEIISTWNLERIASTRRELSVPLPRGVQITSVAAGDRELDWRIVRGATSASDRASIALPTTQNRTAVQIVVTAWHPLVVDHSWQLPVLRPDGAFWSSGRIDLTIVPALELQHFNPVDCVQIDASRVGAGSTEPESYSLIAHAPTATVEATLGRRLAAATLRLGSSLVLVDQDVTGRLVTEWNVARSGLHRLSGELAAGWNIETVETIPANALAEWFIDRRGNRRQLEIQLTDAASPERKISVVIMARLQRFSLAEPIPASALRMVDWSGGRVTRHLLSFQSSEPFAVEPVGELPFVAPESITDFDRFLLDAAADDHRVVDLAQAGSGAGLQLTFQRGTYKAEVELVATYTGSELRQRYHIRAEPVSNAVDRLLIYSTAQLPANTRWIEKSTDSPLTAERLPADDPQYRDLPDEGELWLLRLPQPTADAIEVLVSATIPWPNRENVALVALPDAAEQRGRVIVRSVADAIPSIHPFGLVPTPRPLDVRAADRSDNATLIRAAYRFDPADCLRATRATRLSIGPGARNGTSSLVARYLDLESFCWPDGRATHRAAYQLENCGASEFKPALLPGAQLTSISVNGQSLSMPHSAAGGVPTTIRLPSPVGPSTVALYFETHQPPLVTGRAVTPPIVRSGIPVLAGEWTVWLPEEYAVRAAEQPGGAQLTWQQRLFGPLARSKDAPPFHPFQLDDWARLVNGIAGWPSTPAHDSAPQDAAVSDQPRQLTTASAAGSQTEPVDGATFAAKSPTSGFAQVSSRGESLPGWRAFHETFVADGSPAPVVVLHPPATTTWAVALLLGAYLLGRRLCRLRGTLLLTLMALVACLALLLPAAFAPLATGALWGLMFSCLAEWPRQWLSVDRTANGSRRLPVAGALLFAAACGIAQHAFADPTDFQPPAPAATAANKIERVLIPVDATRRPSGTRYYVSERFLRELLAATSAQTTAENRWLLIDATYAGELLAGRERADIVAGAFALTFSIETFARDTTIVLPLVQNEADWQPTAMLDGVPMPLQWRPATGGCAVGIAQSGRYALTVYCVPKTTAADGRSRFRLSIPPLASATLKLHAPPATTTDITVPGAMLAPLVKASSGALSARLGPTDQLVVEWPRAEPKNGAAPGATVTALSWLHVGEETTELETKYIVEGDARRPESLTVTFDERWKPVSHSPAADGERLVDASTGLGSLDARLPAAGAERQEVTLRWQLTGAPAAGAIRLPPIALSSIVPSQRWFALSADASLDCAVDDESATSATAKEFLAKWGASPEFSPQLVIANFDAAREPTLTIRPREGETVAREVLHVAFGAKAIRVVYQANVTPGAANQYQFRFVAPADLEVDEIGVTAAEQNIPVRWTRDAAGRINVFFGERAASDYRIVLAGVLPVVAGEPSRLPRVTATAAASSAQQLQLYRDDEVRVALQGLTPADESSAGSTDLPPLQWLVRPLGIYHVDEAAITAARAIITRNEAKVSGDSLTALAREAGGWRATFRCRLSVDSGALDVLRLRVPTVWSGPLEIESSVPVTTETTPLDDRHQVLAIRLAATAAEGGSFDLRIRGPLATPPGVALSLPDIALVPAAEGHRYAIVPTSFDSQTIAWAETGVRAANVPKTLLPAPVDAANQRQLVIVGEPFRVAVIPRASKLPSPLIRLADMSISVGDRGSQLIATRLVLTSDGLTDCTLQLPADDELVSVKLDGQPALYSPLDDSRWRIVLGAADLPQLLEIEARSGSGESGSAHHEFRRPTLLAGGQSVPVEISLWTITEPRRFADVRAADAARVSPLDQAALRIDRLASTVEAATGTATEAPTPDGDNWLRAWSALVRNVQTQTERLRTLPTAGPAAAQVSRTSEEQLDGASRRLDAWLQQVNAGQEASVATPANSSQPATAWMWTPPPGDAAVTCYVAEGGADRLAVHAARTNVTWLNTRFLPLAVIAGLTGIIVWLLRSPVAADVLCRWPHTVVVVAGIIWWAWLWPSWLGLLIVAVSVWLALHFEWPGRSFRAEASTVLRSTRTQ